MHTIYHVASCVLFVYAKPVLKAKSADTEIEGAWRQKDNFFFF